MRTKIGFLKSVQYKLHNDQKCKNNNVTELMLSSQFDIMFHLFCNSILTSTTLKSWPPGVYYMVVSYLSVGETG